MQYLRKEQSRRETRLATDARLSYEIRSGSSAFTKEHELGPERAEQSAEVGSAEAEYA